MSKKIISMNKYLIIASAILLSACEKGWEDIVTEPAKPKCQVSCLISEKFRADTTLIKIDTIWKDQVCGRWLDTMLIYSKKPAEWLDFRNCPPPWPHMPEFRLEKRYYIMMK